jgi:hypothetical protein
MRNMKTLPMLAALILTGLPHAATQAGEKNADNPVDKVFDEAMRSQDMHLLTASGQRYEAGVGVGQDADKAVRLYCRAAQMGDPDAKYRLGYLYAYGRGVKRDPDLAAAWFGDAVKAQHSMAAAQLRLLKVSADPKRRPSCIQGGGGSSQTQVVIRTHPATGEIAKLVHSLAPKYKLDPSLVLAVVEAESNFNPQARSPKDAQGLMQLIPATADRFGVKDVWDPEQNLNGGMAYLRWLLDHFDGDIKLALAGYNAGEGAVEKHGGVPPFEETQSYVARIMRRLGLEDGPKAS